jgi:hypothetical protein
MLDHAGESCNPQAVIEPLPCPAASKRRPDELRRPVLLS